MRRTTEAKRLPGLFEDNDLRYRRTEDQIARRRYNCERCRRWFVNPFPWAVGLCPKCRDEVVR